MQELQAGCKVNLFLHILGRRSDGLHELQSLFYPLPSPKDRIFISEAAPGAGLDLSCSDPGLQSGQNILARTYELYADQTGLRPDLKVYLEKNIPQGAGLGGGSSDAASFLLYLDKFSKIGGKQSAADLRALASQLGADVSFFLQNSPAWVEGFGQRVTPVDVDLKGLRLLVVCPGIHISTKEAYSLWDNQQAKIHPQPVQAWALTSNKRGYNNLLPVKGRLLWNSFEQILFDRYPDLQYIKTNLLAHGAAAAVLSGSGSALLGLFRSNNALQSVRAFLIREQIDFLDNFNAGV